MIEIPIWLFVLLDIFGFIGLVHLILYIALLFEGVKFRKINDESERKCPDFIESDEE